MTHDANDTRIEVDLFDFIMEHHANGTIPLDGVKYKFVLDGWAFENLNINAETRTISGKKPHEFPTIAHVPAQGRRERR